MNRNLAIVFLCGETRIDNPGISSYHLNGTLNPSVRNFDTGFISFDKNPGAFPENFASLFDFLKSRNPLYNGIEEITASTISKFTISLKDKIGASAAFLLPDQSVMTAFPAVERNENDFYVFISRKDDGEPIKLPFEVAIASLFPYLFPYGPLIDIPGNTIREKTKNLLLSHPRFRVGPVAAQLILFCFDIIVKNENYYFQKFIKPKQAIHRTEGTDRSIQIGNIVRKDDPSFSTYWFTQLQGINAYCEQFGNPDLMITLTFGNKWNECTDFIADIKKSFPKFSDSHFDMLYCGVESMFFFRDRLSTITKNSFSEFLELSRLPKCAHNVVRLEFQGRGAPHVHIMLWLEDRLSLDDIRAHFFGSSPPEEAEFMKFLIDSQMVHKCKYPRCFSGKNKDKCKYNFPKPVSETTHYDEEDHLIYARSISDKNLVEHCPALLLLWGAHAHVHILRCQDHENNSMDSVHYVLKYNMKSESNITVIVENSDLDWKTVFDGRVVSLEEAASRIFSIPFCEKDIICKFIDTSLPNERKAAFDEIGRQKSFDDIEAYLIRPDVAENLTILEFYSLYDIHYVSDTKGFSQSVLSKTGSIEDLYYYVNRRTKPCIVTFRNYDFMKQRENFLYHYIIINNRLRVDALVPDGISYDTLFNDLTPIVFDNTDPCVYFYLRFLVMHQRYSDFFVLNRCIALLKNGYSKKCIIGILLSLRRDFLAEEGEEIEYDPNVFPNRRVISIVDNFTNYTSGVDAEDSLDSFEVSDSIARNYVTGFLSEDEVSNAAQKHDQMLSMLNNDQRKAYKMVIECFKSRKPVFISGKAGTGKSFLIECLKNYFMSQRIIYAVTASTGIASILIGGRTLHSAFAIFSQNEKYYSGLTPDKSQGKSMALCEVLFIDEVTMLNKDILELVDIKLKELKSQVKGDKRLLNFAFGGVMVILTGDLCQVPCVVKNSNDVKEFNEMFINAQMFNQFEKVALQQLMRQHLEENDPFMTLLENVRNFKDGTKLPFDSLSLIRNHFIKISSLEQYFTDVYSFLGESGMAIFYKNKSCEEFNDIIVKSLCRKSGKVLLSNEGSLIASPKTSFIYGNHRSNTRNPATDEDKKIYKSILKTRESQSLVPYNLVFFIGARVMLLKNIDASTGLVNGRRGTVIDVMQEEDTGKIVAIIVLFDAISTFPEKEEIIHMIKVDCFRRSNGKILNFYQFPLKLCYSVTAHKSQGQTIDRVAICIDEKAFAHGSFYVALSRAHSIDDILFFGKKFPENGPDLHNNGYIADLQFKLLHHLQ